MNKLQQLLSDLTDASTVNDNHQSVIVVEDAIEMIEQALEDSAIVPLADIQVIKELWIAGFDPDEQLSELFKATQQGE